MEEKEERKKRQINTTQMKVQTGNLGFQINEEETGKLPEKKIKENESKDDQKPWKQNGEHASIN